MAFVVVRFKSGGTAARHGSKPSRFPIRSVRPPGLEPLEANILVSATSRGSMQTVIRINLGHRRVISQASRSSHHNHDGFGCEYEMERCPAQSRSLVKQILAFLGLRPELSRIVRGLYRLGNVAAPKSAMTQIRIIRARDVQDPGTTINDNRLSENSRLEHSLHDELKPRWF
jgi:hypothetical protein